MQKRKKEEKKPPREAVVEGKGVETLANAALFIQIMVLVYNTLLSLILVS